MAWVWSGAPDLQAQRGMDAGLRSCRALSAPAWPGPPKPGVLRPLRASVLAAGLGRWLRRVRVAEAWLALPRLVPRRFSGIHLGPEVELAPRLHSQEASVLGNSVFAAKRAVFLAKCERGTGVPRGGGEVPLEGTCSGTQW